MSILKYAVDYAEYQAEIDHLESLIQDGVNDEQYDFIQGYINHLGDRFEEYDCHLLEMDDEGSFYNEVRDLADSMTISPSAEFLSSLDKLADMTMDNKEYQIKKAVDKFNSFYYSCAITINDYGNVSWHGCWLDENTTGLLINKKRPSYRKITVEDVKRKIAEFNK